MSDLFGDGAQTDNDAANDDIINEIHPESHSDSAVTPEPDPQAAQNPIGEALPPSVPPAAEPTTPNNHISDDEVQFESASPAPPRWRFLNEAKKSAGYSSMEAGRYVEGISAEELGAKYTPPDIASLRQKFEERSVGKLLFGEWKRPAEPEIEKKEFPGLPKKETPPAEPLRFFREWDLRLQASLRKSRETLWKDPKENWNYFFGDEDSLEREKREVGKLPLPSVGPLMEEEMVGEYRRRRKMGGAPDLGSYENDSSDLFAMPPRAFPGSDSSSEVDFDWSSCSGSSIKDSSSSVLSQDKLAILRQYDEVINRRRKRKRRRRCCFILLILLLLLIIIILAVILGTRTSKERAESGASRGVIVPIVVDTIVPSSSPSANSTETPTSIPSNAPSMLPSSARSKECPLGTTSFVVTSRSHDQDSLWESEKLDFPVAWTLRDACSGKVESYCTPCPTGTTNTADGPIGDPTAESSANNNIRESTFQSEFNEESPLQSITRCVPYGKKYMFEVAPTDGSCCGFTNSIYKITYDNVVVIEGRTTKRTVTGTGVKSYFGEEDIPCPSDAPSIWPTEPPSEEPSSVPSPEPSEPPSEPPSLSPSIEPTNNPTIPPTPYPSSTPTTHPPTQQPVTFVGGCPGPFIPMSYYTIGSRVERNGIVYECLTYSCGSYGFEPGSQTSSLWRQGWKVVGSCNGTMTPTSNPTQPPTPMPTAPPTRRPTSSPTATPTPKPTLQPTPLPTPFPSKPPSFHPTQPLTPRPTPFPTCAPDKDFNACFAVDMSGSVCNDGYGFECGGCKPTAVCQSYGLSTDTCCWNFHDVVEFSKSMVSSLSLLPTDQSFSIVEFATYAELVSGLSSAEETLEALDGLGYSGGMTNHAEAITLCQQTLSVSPHPDRKDFIILITDGESSQPDYTKITAEAARYAGTFIIPVLIGPMYGGGKEAIEFMEEISSDGNVIDVTDFDALKTVQDSLFAQVSCQAR